MITSNHLLPKGEPAISRVPYTNGPDRCYVINEQWMRAHFASGMIFGGIVGMAIASFVIMVVLLAVGA